MAEVMVRDETMAGRAIDEWILPDLPDEITARELLRLRVREEVARFHATAGEAFCGLTAFTVRRGQRLDWTAQADAACQAFARNGFVMIVGRHQVDDLDQLIDLRGDPTVAFIRLVPLVGG
ncbi:hypothetical protein AB0C29_22540 [Actinoplanes sp. NPDC048791]|uniref:hypothetical protein n=1 Tax=Actinoplanes sp. NPDC048791 TaxID=3154623 RepID=UPI0033CD9DEC